MKFTWTKAAPTVVGWYWVRFPSMDGCSPAVTIIPVSSRTDCNGHTVFRCNYILPDSGGRPVSEVVGEWAGPIPMPAEAA